MDLQTEIKQVILEALEGAEVQILDPRNDGVHLEAIVVAKQFEDKNLVQQHRLVMQSLKNHFHSSLHALGLKTFTPSQWEKVQKNES